LSVQQSITSISGYFLAVGWLFSIVRPCRVGVRGGSYYRC